MNILFLTLIDFTNINDRGIYHDLLRKFRDEGHQVYVIHPLERRKNLHTFIRIDQGITILGVQTLNIQKTNIFEKGIGTIMLESQFLKELKKHFSKIRFDLVLYSTPPITLTGVIKYIKQKDESISYLLLKDIFPQNAVDLGMIKKGGIIHKFFTRKEEELYKCSDYIGCMSPANVDYIKSHHRYLNPNIIEVNPNSIAPVFNLNSDEEKKNLRKKYYIPQNDVVFIYGGNLGKPQGIDFLIQILSSNLNKKNVFFVIAGGGTKFKVIDRWFKENNPQNALLFASLPKFEYDQLLRATDVGLIFLDKRFTIPNFPSRLLSYLENQLPVLAAIDKTSDIGKIVQEAECGLWSESGDLVTFNKHLNTFIENKQLISEMGKNGYELLVRDYTVDVSYNSIIQKVYNSS